MPRFRRGPWSYLSASLTVFTLALLLVFLGTPAFPPEPVFAAPSGQSAGSLGIIGKDGAIKGDCPLKHTDVRSAISGFLARITVTQIFENAASNPIEAVYTFPLPQDAAVDDMTIQIGGRTIRSVIKKREEARAIYEKAKATGHTAALLDQERPNVFSQAVANIMPGEQVSVTISYAETLQYADGAYEFAFPMVVGPRYIPGQATGKQAGGWSPDTNKVPDASRITPNVALPGTRAGHDISLELAIDAGVPIQELRSTSHKIEVEHTATGFAKVSLQNEGEIPNKDFVLKYNVAGEQISDAVLSHWVPQGAADGGYFSLILQPPARVPESDVTPKELVFVLDTSGSMWGFPLDKAKEFISHALDELYPGDTFNLITFSGDTHILFPEPVYPTAENIRKAKAVLASRTGGGGTEMMTAIRAALAPSDHQDHVRVVCFITDGYVGNDMEIVGEIQKHPNARVFSFGIGNSVNRFLLDKMAETGRGAVEYVNLADKADEAADRFYERVRAPLLTDLYVDWGGLPVADVYPTRMPDLFSGQPLIITGRYTKPASGTVHLKGTRVGGAFSRDIPVTFSASTPASDALAGFWARRRIDDLMSQDWLGMQTGGMKPELKEQITQLGLDYRLMTQFTSFVAVEDKVVTKNGTPQRVEIPVEMPEGVSYEGVFGDQKQYDVYTVNRVVGGVPGGVSGGYAAAMISSAPTMANRSITVSGLAKTQNQNPGPPPSVAGPVAPTQVVVPSMIPKAKSPSAEADRLAAKPAQSPERRALESKLQPALLAALDCFLKSSNGRVSCRDVHSGKVEITVWFADNAPANARTQLQALGLGFTKGPVAQNVVAGVLSLDKLEDLAKLPFVKFVSFQRR